MAVDLLKASVFQTITPEKEVAHTPAWNLRPLLLSVCALARRGIQPAHRGSAVAPVRTGGIWQQVGGAGEGSRQGGGAVGCGQAAGAHLLGKVGKWEQGQIAQHG